MTIHVNRAASSNSHCRGFSSSSPNACLLNVVLVSNYFNATSVFSHLTMLLYNATVCFLFRGKTLHDRQHIAQWNKATINQQQSEHATLVLRAPEKCCRSRRAYLASITIYQFQQFNSSAAAGSASNHHRLGMYNEQRLNELHDTTVNPWKQYDVTTFSTELRDAVPWSWSNNNKKCGKDNAFMEQ